MATDFIVTAGATMIYSIEYELGNIKTKDTITAKKTDDIIDYIMNTKAGRERLLKQELTFNIISIKKSIHINEDEEE